MMKWLAQRFQYTRDLEKKDRLHVMIEDGLHATNGILEEILEEYRVRKTEFSQMTLDEIQALLSACVDYHEALHSLSAADPIQDRVLHIFEKYNIQIIRNKFAAHDQRLSKRFKKTVENRD